MSVIERISELQDFYVLSWRSLSGLMRRPFYLSDTVEQMDYTGAGSLPIILVVSVFVGMALSLQLETQLAFMGLENYTGRVVAMAVIREIGPVIVALVYAGRAGSGMSSELGSMVLGHQVDTLRVFGVDPVKKLVIPRMLGSVVMLPALTIIGDAAALLGGYYIAVYVSHLSGSNYWLSVRNVLSFGYVFPGIIKPFVFGYLIACISCYMGLATRGGALGLRGSTTKAFVVSTITIIVFDFFITKVVIYLIGY
jgi:phospholipid/cholesterol/gamma-HCH transport system permease protein